MYNVVLFGAGKSSVYLLKKMLEYTDTPINLILIANDFNYLPQEFLNNKKLKLIEFDVTNNSNLLYKYIEQQDLVISMLPAHLHTNIAKLCLKYNKNLLTASYVSKEMQALDKKAKKLGLLFLNEMGLDPGLDHMSTMQMVNDLKEKGAVIKSFSSHTGGLIEKTTKNSWNYKFTWNPLNVILAGADGATYLENGEQQYIPYLFIFKNPKEIFVNGISYDSYPNRNSVGYIEKYNLLNCETMYRGTLRHSGFSNAWNIFVKLGMTANKDKIKLPLHSSRKDFLNFFLKENTNVIDQFCKEVGIGTSSSVFKMMDEIKLFSNTIKLEINKGTPAQILLSILEKEWQLKTQDLDCVVMLHNIEYTIDNKKINKKLELHVSGENQIYTAMSKTVGLPMYEATMLMLQNKIGLTGVQIPINPIIYNPILKNLEKNGIVFNYS